MEEGGCREEEDGYNRDMENVCPEERVTFLFQYCPCQIDDDVTH